MDKKVFSVYMGNPDNSNHAELELPATPWELVDAMDRLRLSEGQEPYWQVEDMGRYCDPPYYEAECYTVEFPRSDHQRLHDALAAHRGFVMVSYNNCAYIRELYDDFYIYEVERPNSQSKKKNDRYQEYIMTNYDARIFAPQMTLFGDYANGERSCKLVHIPERPLPRNE